MKNKFAFALAGFLALSTSVFAADGRDRGYRGDQGRAGYHETYRRADRSYQSYGYHNYGYRSGGGVYLGIGPSYYSDYVSPTSYVDPSVYAAPAPYADPYAAPYGEQYVGPAPLGEVWIGGGWVNGPRGRYWARGHWGRR